jgi:hypothetical protein
MAHLLVLSNLGQQSVGLARKENVFICGGSRRPCGPWTGKACSFGWALHRPHHSYGHTDPFIRARLAGLASWRTQSSGAGAAPTQEWSACDDGFSSSVIVSSKLPGAPDHRRQLRRRYICPCESGDELNLCREHSTSRTLPSSKCTAHCSAG